MTNAAKDLSNVSMAIESVITEMDKGVQKFKLN